MDLTLRDVAVHYPGRPKPAVSALSLNLAKSAR